MPVHLEGLRGGRQRRRPQGPLQPGRRDLRRGPLPEGRRRRDRPAAARSSPTTTPLVRGRGAALRRTSTASSPRTSSARSPGLTQGDRFPVAANARYADDISERAGGEAREARQGLHRQRRRRGLKLTHTSRDQHLLPRGRAGRRGQRRRRSSRSATTPGSATSSSSRTTTATASPTRSSAASPRSTRCRSSTSSRPPTSSSSRPKRDKAPDQPREPAARRAASPLTSGRAAQGQRQAKATPSRQRGPVNTEDLRPRLYALPERPHNVDRADITGQLDNLLSKRFPGYSTFKSYFGGVLHFDRRLDGAAPAREGLEGGRRHRPRPRSARPTSSRRT